MAKAFSRSFMLGRLTPVVIFFLFFVLYGMIEANGKQAKNRYNEPKASSGHSVVVQRFTRLTRQTEWQLVHKIPLAFPTYHAQGLARVGGDFFMSSVEIITPTESTEGNQGDYDRTPGEGRGHLFRFNAQGKLLADIELGEGTIYHPGGIDYGGGYLWVPVAEYRPDSRSIIYRVDPRTLEVVELFRFKDHIGAVAYNPANQTLHGVSWSAKGFYTWMLDGEGGLKNTEGVPSEKAANGSFYIAYQDCQHIAKSYMLCSGMSMLEIPGIGEVALGGLDLVDFDRRSGAIWQVPVPLYVTPTIPMTRNPFYVEASDNGLRFYFIPEDGQSTMYVYETSTS